VWRDLTVRDAAAIRDFYSKVVGWTSSPVELGEYNDFSMAVPGGDDVVAGICHARGGNANLPPQWLIYITVEDVEKSARRCVEHGGRIIDGPKAMGKRRFCVIQDPAGAVAALISP
jgi:predicted enzyme related to lactoylglutathione lyase